MAKVSLYQTGNLVFLFFFLSVTLSFAQTDQQATIDKVKELQKQADSAYGSSHELVNGKLYYQTNLYALGTPFFLSEDWIVGDVTINDKKHDGIFLKYNLETDQLILHPTIKNGMSSAIVLNAPFVKSFQMGDYLFVNTNSLGAEYIKSTYANLVYEGTFDFLITYKIGFVNDYNIKTPYGKYSAIVNSYFIYSDDGLVKISSKKALMSYFESYKKAIKKYMKKEKIRFGKASFGQWLGLMKFIDDLVKASAQ